MIGTSERKGEQASQKTAKPHSKAKVSLGIAAAAVGMGLIPNPLHALVLGSTDDAMMAKLEHGSKIGRSIGASHGREASYLPVQISSVSDPDYKQAALEPEAIRINVDGKLYEVFGVKDRAPAYQTADGTTEFYLSDISAAKSEAGISSGYNVSFGINKSTRLEFKEGTFLIPSPSSDMSHVLRSDFFQRNNLEFVGIAGTGYVHSSDPIGNRRVGFGYLKGEGVIYDTLQKDQTIRRGYYTEEDGKVRALDLSGKDAKTMLNRLMSNKHVIAISVFHHGEGGKASFDGADGRGKRYRTPYIVFNQHSKLLGMFYTSESENNATREAQLKRAFPTSANAFKLDGDFYSKFYIAGGYDAPHSSELALNFESAQLIVKKASSTGAQNNLQETIAIQEAGAGRIAYAKAANIYRDVRDVSKVEQKLNDKLPGILKWSAGTLARWGASNPYFRGWMMRKALGDEVDKK